MQTAMLTENKELDLSKLYPFDKKHLAWIFSFPYGPAEAERRARNVVSDAERIGIEPTLSLLPFHGGLSVPFDTFGQPAFSPDNLDKNVPDTLKAVGFGLNWGDPHVLSHVCELARTIWGENWTPRFRDKLRHFDDHLATIEELWWLGLWHTPSNVRHEICLGKTTKTVD